MIHIILVNYNGWKDTVKCVESIKENEKKAEYEIVVVDNASTNESVVELKKVKGIKLIESNENLGFAKGNNLGIKYALENNTEAVVLLNNDTEIEENAMWILYDTAFSDEKVGLVGSRIMYYENKKLINFCGGRMDWFKGTSDAENYQTIYEPGENKIREIGFVSGCCMFIKREILNKVGFLPEEYFMYYEDTDYCMQVLEAGYKLLINEDSVIYHKASASSGGEESDFCIKWATRNRIIFMKKYKKYTKGILTKIFFYGTRRIKIVLYILKGKKSSAKAMSEGLKMGREYLKNK